MLSQRKMRVNSNIRGRRSIRLKGWDYFSPGWYFVTICAQNRECLFGNVENEKMALTDAGRMIEKIWLDMHKKYSGITVEEFVVMPNHIHGILGLHVGAGLCACPSELMRRIGKEDAGRTRGSAPTGKNLLSLPDVIRQFKTFTTKKYTDNIIHSNWPEFQNRLWQRNYFEHIIRDEKELDQIRQYVQNNPADWPLDDENSARKKLLLG